MQRRRLAEPNALESTNRAAFSEQSRRCLREKLNDAGVLSKKPP
jgi:hypothetical protein